MTSQSPFTRYRTLRDVFLVCIATGTTGMPALEAGTHGLVVRTLVEDTDAVLEGTLESLDTLARTDPELQTASIEALGECLSQAAAALLGLVIEHGDRRCGPMAVTAHCSQGTSHAHGILGQALRRCPADEWRRIRHATSPLRPGTSTERGG